MGIQKDAGEVLFYLYNIKISGKELPNLNGILEETGWEKNRGIFALEYLLRKELLYGKVIKTLGSKKTKSISINDISPYGIDVVENEKEFSNIFGFGINLGVISFSWTKQEK